MTDQKEDETWKLLKQGNQEAFALIYRNHFSSMYEYASRIVSSDCIIKDAIHDLFVKIWLNRQQLADVTHIKGYLFRALRNLLLNHLKKSHETYLSDPSLELLKHFDVVYSVEATLISNEISRNRSLAVQKALSQLSTHQKEVLYLRYYEDLDYEDIAEILCISVKAVYKLTARSLKNLKKAFPLPYSAFSDP